MTSREEEEHPRSSALATRSVAPTIAMTSVGAVVPGSKVGMMVTVAVAVVVAMVMVVVVIRVTTAVVEETMVRGGERWGGFLDNI